METDKPLETDWKAFRKLVPSCRERYLDKVNERIATLLSTEEDLGLFSEEFAARLKRIHDL